MCLHVGGKRHLVRESIKALEAKLDPNKFVRLHRSAIVNIDHVREIHRDGRTDGWVFLSTGERVRLNRGGLAEIDCHEQLSDCVLANIPNFGGERNWGEGESHPRRSSIVLAETRLEPSSARLRICPNQGIRTCDSGVPRWAAPNRPPGPTRFTLTVAFPSSVPSERASVNFVLKIGLAQRTRGVRTKVDMRFASGG